jgi:hypothetical protein
MAMMAMVMNPVIISAPMTAFAVSQRLKTRWSSGDMALSSRGMSPQGIISMARWLIKDETICSRGKINAV